MLNVNKRVLNPLHHYVLSNILICIWYTVYRYSSNGKNIQNREKQKDGLK